MNLEYSVEQLYETGWQPDVQLRGTEAAPELERLPDGR